MGFKRDSLQKTVEFAGQYGSVSKMADAFDRNRPGPDAEAAARTYAERLQVRWLREYDDARA